MVTIEEQVSLAAPPEKVFATLTDPGAYPRWIADVKSVRTDGPFQTGSRFEEVTQIGGKDKVSAGFVVAVESPRRVVLQVTEVRSGPKLFPTRTFDLEPVNGGTLLRWRTDLRTEGMARLLQPFLPRLFRRKKRGYLAEFKRLADSS
jgi:uncharacterized protein YndB with AHSA1/START domain